MGALVYYRNNPNLKKKVVTLKNGELEYASNCKVINGALYRVGEECVYVKGMWYLKTDPRILYDNEIQQWVKSIEDAYVYGAISINDDTVEMGHYSPNLLKNCQVGIVSQDVKVVLNCIDFNIPKSKGFEEFVNESLWASKKFLETSVSVGSGLISRFIMIRSNLNKMLYDGMSATQIKNFKFPENSYNAEDSSNFYKYGQLYERHNTILSKKAIRASKLIGDVTFGTEIEAKSGNLPSYQLAQLGVIICKDGSIGYTPEFVTVPYKGAKGLQSLFNLFKQLNTRCTTDHTCSLHYHFGSIRKDREFLVASYILYRCIQKDLHKMLPYYKTDPSGVKDKNYCAFLPDLGFSSFLKMPTVYKNKINSCYNRIQSWILEEGSPSKSYNRKNKRHPNGTSKWNLHTRYMSQNYMNMFVSDRNTIEYRAHHGVLEPTRAINWFFICNAITKYAELNSSKIIKDFMIGKVVNFMDVLRYYETTFKTPYAKSVSEYLTAYYLERVSFFERLRIREDDRTGFKDYIDKKYDKLLDMKNPFDFTVL